MPGIERWRSACRRICAAVGVFALLIPAMLRASQGTPYPGVYFANKDWEIACDNTGTCRAAGYHSEADGAVPPVSVLLTRAAGPGAEVRGRLRLESADDERRPGERITMSVDGRTLGPVGAELTGAQVRAIVSRPSAQKSILFDDGRIRRRLSDNGLTAVLLKMDEVQGRIGTPGALVRAGVRPEATVPPGFAAPDIAVPVISRTTPTIPQDRLEALLQELQSDPSNRGCRGLEVKPAQPPSVGVDPLDGQWLLVSTVCFSATENQLKGFWVVARTGSLRPALVALDATEAYDGLITRRVKGRGPGDCWEGTTWAWNGTRFLLAEETYAGLCRGLAGGGWYLPTRTATINNPNTRQK